MADDSQPVEQYNGALGVSRAFVAAHQAKTSIIRWNDDLASRYTDPGTVNGAEWCTGVLMSENLFLTAGHCFDQNPRGWRVPRINGSRSLISSTEIATNMHVGFNFQVDPSGVLRDVVRFPVVRLLEYRLGNLDVGIVELGGSPRSPIWCGRTLRGRCEQSGHARDYRPSGRCA